MIVTETYKEDTTMDAFENSEFEYIPETPEEPELQQPCDNPYHGAGAGRKESPYANSPYVMPEFRQEQPYRYEPQVQPPRKPRNTGNT